jgi:hypothetical protein
MPRAAAARAARRTRRGSPSPRVRPPGLARRPWRASAQPAQLRCLVVSRRRRGARPARPRRGGILLLGPPPGAGRAPPARLFGPACTAVLVRAGTRRGHCLEGRSRPPPRGQPAAPWARPRHAPRRRAARRCTPEMARRQGTRRGAPGLRPHSLMAAQRGGGGGGGGRRMRTADAHSAALHRGGAGCPWRALALHGLLPGCLRSKTRFAPPLQQRAGGSQQAPPRAGRGGAERRSGWLAAVGRESA